MWFVKMGGWINGRCVVCMGNGVEIRFVVAHDKTNGWWEGWGSMGHGMFGAHEKGCLIGTHASPIKNLPIAIG